MSEQRAIIVLFSNAVRVCMSWPLILWYYSHKRTRVVSSVTCFKTVLSTLVSASAAGLEGNRLITGSGRLIVGQGLLLNQQL